MLREHNLDHAQALALMKKAVSLQRSYAQARLRYVLVKLNGNWKSPIAVLHAFSRQDLPSETEPLIYPGVEFHEKWFTLDSLIEQLRHGVIDLENLDIRLIDNSRWTRERLPSGNDFSRYPGDLYKIRWHSENVGFAQEELLSYGKPYFAKHTDAIREWTETRYPESFLLNGELLMFFPEYRAYFESLKHQNGVLSIEITKPEPDVADLRVLGGWSQGHRSERFDIPISDEVAAEVELPNDVDRLEAFLIDPTDSVFDYHRETLHWCQGLTRLFSHGELSASDDAIVRRALASGEGVEIEFKPFVDPENPKVNEIVTTVVAFANTLGGAILIGVRDNFDIEGVEDKALQRYRKSDPTIDAHRACTKYALELLQRINGRLTPSIASLEVGPVAFGGKIIVLIKVPEGEDGKLYRDFQNQKLYVRRGANNAHPNDDELRDLCKPWNNRGTIYE